MSMTETVNFIDNKAALAKPQMYMCIHVDVSAALQSWRLSVFSYEWMNSDGSIKDMSDLSDAEAEKREYVEMQIREHEPLEKPVLGIGIQDNVEIGSGRAVLLTLAAQGIKTIPVHILKSNESDFKAFLADVS